MLRLLQTVVYNVLINWYLGRGKTPPLQLLLDYFAVCPQHKEAWVAKIAVREYPDEPYAQWLYSTQISDPVQKHKLLRHIIDLMAVSDKCYSVEFGKLLASEMVDFYLSVEDYGAVRQWYKLRQKMMERPDVEVFQILDWIDTPAD